MAGTQHNSPAKGFTTAFLDNLKPKRARYEIPDKGKSGLRVRVEPSGRKVFRWYHRSGGKTKVLTLGSYGTGEGRITLQQARSALDRAKELHRAGERVGPAPDAPTTVAALAELFYERRIVPHRTRPDVVRAILDHDVIPKLGRRKLQTLTAPAVAAVVESVVDRGATTHAGKVLAVLKQLFKFAESRGYIDRSPAYALDRKDLGVVDNIRERYLDGAEVRALWRALDQAPRMSEPTRNGIRILLLTGVRTSELLKARWEHIDFNKGEWFVPEVNSKTTAWTVPLTPAVVTLFEALHDIAQDVPDTDGTRPSPWVMASEDSAVGHVTDKTLGRAFRRLFELRVDGKPLLDIAHCSPHDLRRTLRTHLADLKMLDPETGTLRDIEPHIAEKCLNHSLGRIEKTYNRNSLLKQRRAALVAWAAHVDLLVTHSGRVVVLEGRGRGSA